MDLVQQTNLPDFEADFLLDHKHQTEPGCPEPNWCWMDWPVECTDRSLREVIVVEMTYFMESTAR